ncbi:MAG TPA: GGDEF domain-containing protein [Acidimicrobiales bacterium]|nr:GGDEF domain-containing protein [Acidimicrobiales bacterium]
MDAPDDELQTAGDRWQQLAPFILAYGLGFALAWLPSQGPEHVLPMIGAGVIIVVVAASILLGGWTEVSELYTLIPVVGLCLAIDLMRYASGNGSTAGYGSLLLLPVVWQALRRGQLVLNLTIVAVSVTNVIAVVFLSSPVPAAAQWRSIILFTIVAATIGQTIQRLVRSRTELLQEISRLARLDPLTGLANRRTWDERFPEEAERATRRGLPMAVALIDLDHFKAFNDQHGHQAGDRLLTSAAAVWSADLRTGDLLARWGGEEFALLMPATDEDEAAAILERLQGLTPEGQSFSAGVTVERFRPGFDRDLDAVLHSADQAMYAAKEGGRARTSFAPPRPVADDVIVLTDPVAVDPRT